MPGKLILVPTPVGNLEDITLRAIRMLRECDIVLAEDTRVTHKLLKHFAIEKPLFAYHKDNEHRQTQRWIKEILSGKILCLCSDAGTPAISDPGFFMVRACLEHGIEPEILPGATSFVPALVKSGFPTDSFTFLGFIPHKKGRQTFIKSLMEYAHTVVFFESTHRIQKLAKEMTEMLPQNMQVCFAKEISKMHETFIRGTLHYACSKILQSDVRGEWVVLTYYQSQKNNHESS
jgi:16S rRNA (cytidine1402-2'-O)-methyltransferase